jgi:hypothetical protein
LWDGTVTASATSTEAAIFAKLRHLRHRPVTEMTQVTQHFGA